MLDNLLGRARLPGWQAEVPAALSALSAVLKSAAAQPG
jgi:hypothetical protein